MKNILYLNELRSAANANSISFSHTPSDPVLINKISDIDKTSARGVVERYTKYGFAVVQLVSDPLGPEILLGLGQAFKLGEPFIPPLYQNGEYIASSVSQISAKLEANTAHPSFENSVALDFHCDGTLQKIGYIKTSMLLCESPSAGGGDTILFNSSAAFTELLESDADAALALAHPGALERQASVNGRSDINKGPAFAIEDNRLVCAYSMTAKDRLVADENVNEKALRRGEEFLLWAAKPGSPYFIQFRLLTGQAIIFANTLICHGRTAYRDAEDHRRCMYRAIYLKEPRINEEYSYMREAALLNYVHQ